MKISIVTVSYNAAATIEQTIQSVVEQGYNDLEYIIIDGGSNDGTVDIIRKYSDKLSYWISEPDHGMYDALIKGLEHVTGDICAYINADDFYQKYAFDIVNQVFQMPDVQWITGIQTTYNEAGQIVQAELPYRYRKSLMRKGLYNGKYLPCVQQESTFWRSDLNCLIDKEKLRGLRYAGDYFLWKSFAGEYALDIVSAVLSGFRIHSGQISEDTGAYAKEMEMLADHKTLADMAIAIFDRVCCGYPIRFNKDIIQYDHVLKTWKRIGR